MFSQEFPDMGPKILNDFIGHIFKLTGITMKPNKLTLIQGRIRHRLIELKLKSYEDYYDYLINHKEESEIFINLITTNETTFFRTQRIWDYFTEDFLIKWHETHKGKKMRIWSAASSTGEEAYSLAIACEEFKKKNIYFEYEILATDISTAVLKKGQEGFYSGRTIEIFRKSRPELVEEYMEAKLDGFVMQDRIKKKVKFTQHNLFNPMSNKEPFDIIFLRNVLIYFEASEQKRVLENIRHVLNSDGILIIGEAESLNNLATQFKYHLPLIYYKGA